MMLTAAERVADRYMVRLAVRKACASKPFRRRSAALADLTPDVLEAFGEGFYLPFNPRMAGFSGLVRKLKEIVRAFKRAPKLWEQFKALLGKDITPIMFPKAIRDLAKQGAKALQRVFKRVFSNWPLKLFTLSESQTFGVRGAIEKLIAKFPQFEKWLQTSVKPRVDQFDQWLKKYVPNLSRLLMVAAFIFIWMNVVEFEWDMAALTAVLAGQMTLAALLASLPGSAIGFLLNGFGFGTFTLLPAALAARLLYLMAKRYIVWTGRGFAWNRENLAADLGTEPAELPI